MHGRLLIAGGLLLVATADAIAQSRSSGSGSSSGFGTSSMGSSSAGFSGTVGNLGSFRSNTSSFGSPSTLRTGVNSGTMGSDAFSGTRQDALAGNRASGSSSGRNAGGRNSSQFGGMSGMNGMNAGRGMNNFGQNSQQSTKRAAQASTQIAFDVPKLDATAVVAAARTPLTTKVMPSGAGVSIQMTNGVAVLSGTVPTQRDAVLAAAVISLEPGVRSIDNRLVVNAAAPAK